MPNTKFCKYCKAVLPEDALFCEECGRSLASEDERPYAPAAPIVPPSEQYPPYDEYPPYEPEPASGGGGVRKPWRTGLMGLAVLCVVLLISYAAVNGMLIPHVSHASPSPSATTGLTSMPPRMLSPTPSETPSQRIITSSTPSPTAASSPRQGTGSTPTQIGPDKWTAEAQDSGVVRGNDVTFGFYIYVLPLSTGKWVCGQYAPFYIDDQAAGGKWVVPGTTTDCARSVLLQLSGEDTAKLSAGTHTLKVDYQGDATHAPSQWVGTFTVRDR